MWAVASFVIAAGLGGLAVLALTRHGSARLDAEPWQLYDTAKLHVSIMGVLAGFAVTGIVLIVSFARSQGTASATSLNTVVVMFTVAYFYYVGNAFLISYLPHRDAAGERVPRIHFSLASTIEYRTLFVSWFALMPLLRTHGLTQAADILAILLPLSLLLGSVIIAMAAEGLGLVRVKETYICLLAGIASALICAAVFRFWLPAGRSELSAIQLTLAIFCINAAAYAVATATALASRYPSVDRFYSRHGRTLVMLDMLLTMTSLAFLWMAVVGAI